MLGCIRWLLLDLKKYTLENAFLGEEAGALGSNMCSASKRSSAQCLASTVKRPHIVGVRKYPSIPETLDICCQPKEIILSYKGQWLD